MGDAGNILEYRVSGLLVRRILGSEFTKYYMYYFWRYAINTWHRSGSLAAIESFYNSLCLKKPTQPCVRRGNGLSEWIDTHIEASKRALAHCKVSIIARCVWTIERPEALMSSLSIHAVHVDSSTDQCAQASLRYILAHLTINNTQTGILQWPSMHRAIQLYLGK